jgi:hypothetical protein
LAHIQKYSYGTDHKVIITVEIIELFVVYLLALMNELPVDLRT